VIRPAPLDAERIFLRHPQTQLLEGLVRQGREAFQQVVVGHRELDYLGRLSLSPHLDLLDSLLAMGQQDRTITGTSPHYQDSTQQDQVVTVTGVPRLG